MAISYEAIDVSIGDKEELNNLILIEKDKDNNVSFISTNSYKVNMIALKIAKNYKNIIKTEFDKGVYVPLGAFTGLNILSGYGKKIKSKLIIIDSVKCEFESSFSEMGINQTRHILISVA